MSSDDIFKALVGTGAGVATTVLGSDLLSKKKESLEKILSRGKATKATADKIRKHLKSVGLNPDDYKFVTGKGIAPGYSESTKTFYLSSDDLSVAHHEAGHAIQHAKSPKLTRAAQMVSSVAPTAILANSLAAYLPGNEVSQKLDKYGPYALAAAALPNIALEYDASKKAKDYLANVDRDNMAIHSHKLDSALTTYLIDGAINPVSWLAGRKAADLVKESGLITSGINATARGVGKALKWGAKSTMDSAVTASRVARDFSKSKGVKAKGKVVKDSLVGNYDSPDSGGWGRKIGLATSVLTPATAAYAISQKPGSAETWGRELGSVSGEVLGGGKMLGGVALSHKLAGTGARAGAKVDKFIRGN